MICTTCTNWNIKKNSMKNIIRYFLFFTVFFLITSCCNDTNSVAVSDSAEKIVVDNMLTRRSIRAYKPEPVPREIMDVILNCGINAPNGMNKQPWEIRVVDNQELLNSMTETYLEGMDKENPRYPKNDPNFRNMFRNAPTVVFIAMQPGLCSQVDCGLLAGNMVNTAWAYGIGSCIQMAPMQFMNSENGKQYLDKLSFSEGYEFLMAIGFGYPDEKPDAKPRIIEKIKYID